MSFAGRTCAWVRQGPHRNWAALAGIALVPGVLGAVSRAATYTPSTVPPPAVVREFRATWIATVNNIDWPSRRTLSVADQQAELVRIFDAAKRLRLNAVVLQVRPSCDAIYASRLEPWSEFLTGRMGRAPEPFYDPLEFAIDQAHARGLELHAWFNPFRVRHALAQGPASAGHVSRTQPGLVKTYGSTSVLDPGETATHDHSINVIMDVVRRYDIDAVHMDDYFYPYPDPMKQGGTMPFRDDSSWGRYRREGGKLDRAAWRRQNVDRFVLRLSRAIKKEKGWVKFGISPFGIWRSGHPSGVKGLSAVDVIYADSRKWLQEGWVDYLSPQLYWATTSPAQSFGRLLEWWSAQNTRQRHLWPGLNLTEPGGRGLRSALEVLKQIELTRKDENATGNILYSVKALVENRQGTARALVDRAYNAPALVPATPWLDKTPPPPPTVQVRDDLPSGLEVRWTPGRGEPVWLWVVYSRYRGQWRTEILTGNQTRLSFPRGQAPELIGVQAVDRLSNAGGTVMLKKTG